MAIVVKKLAKAFQEQLPNAVCIGSTGSGKTTVYNQIAHFSSWDSLLQEHGFDSGFDVLPSYIRPVLGASDCIVANWAYVKRERLSSRIKKQLLETSSRIKEQLLATSDESDWTRFWVAELAEYTCSSASLSFNLLTLGVNAALKTIEQSNSRSRSSCVLLFDGLDEIFDNVASSAKHQNAVRDLLDISYRLNELQIKTIGCIIFLPREMLEHLFPQNAAQFESLYIKFALD